MDELEISGKRYLSTRRAARAHGYHSDYMGQLIRGNKVAGQKVGRSWYIEEDSLNAYLGKTPTEPVEPVVSQVQEVSKLNLVMEEKIEIQKETESEIKIAEVHEAAQLEPVVEIKPAVEIKKEEVKQEPQPTRIPIHIPAAAIQDIGGLRYATDDAPSLPVVMRMPQAHTQQRQIQTATAPAYQPPRTVAKNFPIISLSIVGILALAAAAFASNFVSATLKVGEGKPATVQYAIHW